MSLSRMDVSQGATEFNPYSIVPKSIDLSPHVPQRQKKKYAKKKDVEAEGMDVSLPKRLLFTAMSPTVGGRPLGLQVGQTKMYTKRFLSEFRLGALGKFVCAHLNGIPYVTEEGLLPCFCLSTSNAVKFIMARPENRVDAHPKALSEMQSAWDDGTQIEWIEFKSFLEYQIYHNETNLQSEVCVKPHIADVAIIWWQFCISPQAMAILSATASWATEGAPGSDAGSPLSADNPDAVIRASLSTRGKDVDVAFASFMQGKAVHRLARAKQLLRHTSFSVILQIGHWRKNAHFVFANALAQQYFLCEESPPF